MNGEVNAKVRIAKLAYGFLPSWWNKGYGLRFGSKYVFDPDFRIEQNMRMKKLLAERFPWLCLDEPAFKPAHILPDFGNACTAAYAGCEVIYPDDNHPWNEHLEPALADRLKLPEDISAVFPYSVMIDQNEYINLKYGFDIPPAIVYPGGILNDAVKLMGADFFLELYDDSRAARKLLEFVYGIVERTLDFNYSHGHTGWVVIANCCVKMISPKLYEDRLLAYDLAVYQKTTEHGAAFGIHHCGIFDAYAESYRNVPKMDFLEIGWGSDIRLALDLFPEAAVSYMFGVSYALFENRDAIRREMDRILRAADGHWDRFSINVSDIEYGTPDENLKEIFDAVAACNARGAE